jgi:hypothetical protein
VDRQSIFFKLVDGGVDVHKPIIVSGLAIRRRRKKSACAHLCFNFNIYFAHFLGSFFPTDLFDVFTIRKIMKKKTGVNNTATGKYCHYRTVLRQFCYFFIHAAAEEY